MKGISVTRRIIIRTQYVSRFGQQYTRLMAEGAYEPTDCCAALQLQKKKSRHAINKLCFFLFVWLVFLMGQSSYNFSYKHFNDIDRRLKVIASFTTKGKTIITYVFIYYCYIF